ncbi:MAG: alkaline phosphatase D family protein [Acidimicrobiia bacterium]|nr:alkaline phosphatase D family protein [Acidimicrobiia bacterium]
MPGVPDGLLRRLPAPRGEELDVVCFLGDYIYELEASIEARPHGLAVPRTLDEYRTYYALNKTDPDLQAAHAAHPWIVTWDDHEVEDNYAGLRPGRIGGGEETAADFPARRAAAYRAFWEHLPIRVEAPEGPDLTIYRSFTFGDLLQMAVLDTRQYRTPQPTGEGFGDFPRILGGGPQLPGAFDEAATLLGPEQEAWLEDLLSSSTARWNIVAQQSVMAEVDRAPDDPDKGFSMDSWDGYVAARRRLLGFVAAEGVTNLVSLGGDIHTSAVTDLRADYHDPASPVVGTELVAPSISALELLPEGYAEGALSAPHIHLFDPERRGYLRCDVDRDRIRADYRLGSTILEPTAAIETASSWVIGSGTPGARRVGEG